MLNKLQTEQLSATRKRLSNHEKGDITKSLFDACLKAVNQEKFVKGAIAEIKGENKTLEICDPTAFVEKNRGLIIHYFGKIAKEWDVSPLVYMADHLPRNHAVHDVGVVLYAGHELKLNRHRDVMHDICELIVDESLGVFRKVVMDLGGELEENKMDTARFVKEVVVNKACPGLTTASAEHMLESLSNIDALDGILNLNGSTDRINKRLAGIGYMSAEASVRMWEGNKHLLTLLNEYVNPDPSNADLANHVIGKDGHKLENQQSGELLMFDDVLSTIQNWIVHIDRSASDSVERVAMIDLADVLYTGNKYNSEYKRVIEAVIMLMTEQLAYSYYRHNKGLI